MLIWFGIMTLTVLVLLCMGSGALWWPIGLVIILAFWWGKAFMDARDVVKERRQGYYRND